MAWTASLVSVTKDQFGIASAVVSFTDGVTTRNTTYRGVQSLDNLKRLARDQITAYEAADAAAALPPGAIDLTVTPPPPPPTPTREEIDRAAWLADYRLWIKVKTTLIDTAVLTGNETPVANLKTRVQQNFRAAYLNFI